MGRPQQPEIERSGRTAVDQDHWQADVGGARDADDVLAPVPEENQPGHRPEHEQDRPEVPPQDR